MSFLKEICLKVIASTWIHRFSDAMINSVSLEQSRLADLVPLVSGTGHKVVGLCMSDDGMPKNTEGRVRFAGELIGKLTKSSVAIDKIYIYPVVQPISTENGVGAAFLDAIEQIMTQFPGVHTICGLSNIGFGLPARKLLNRTFAIMAAARGMDGLISDPLDRELMAGLVAVDALAGRDNFCTNYLGAFRKGLLK